MENGVHPWEGIYAREGHVFTEPISGFRFIAERFANHECGQVLDLGCGNGRHLLALKRQGLDVTGLDISPSGLHLAREWLRREGLQATLVCGDARRPFPFPESTFRGLISTLVIHHALLVEVRRTIREIRHVLSESGIAFVTVPGQKDQDMAYKEIEPGTFIPLDGPERGLAHHFFSEEELCQEFASFWVEEIGRRDRGKVIAIWVKKVAGGA